MFEYKLIKSKKRKTIALQINESGELIVRVPFWVSTKKVSEIIRDKQLWIQKHKEKASERHKQASKLAVKDLKPTDLLEIKSKAHSYLQKRVHHFAKLYRFKYKQIKISNAKTRWGSCSANGNINLNWRLYLTPKEVLDYVVIHELVHLQHMNHSKKFWDRVAQLHPNYKKSRKWLRENSHLILV